MRSILLLISLSASTAFAQDVAYVNGKILTLNARSEIVQAVAITDGKISALGTTADIRKLAKPTTRIVDLGGKTALPGFYDNHVHIGGDLDEWKGGLIAAVPDWLRGVDTKAKLRDALKKRNAQLTGDEWLRGSLAREVWPNQLVPTRWELDSAVSNRPVVIARGPHTLLLNSRALAAAGITRDTPNPPGGWIIRDARGEPTGRVLEAARNLVERAVPRGGGRGAEQAGASRDRDDADTSFLKRMAELGITSMNVPGVSPANLRSLQALYERRGTELPRLTVQIRLSPGHDTYDDTEQGVRESIALLEGMKFHTGEGNERIKVGAIKMSVDGGLSAPVFWSINEYKGRPGFHGAQRIPDDVFYRVAKRAHDLGWQLGIHTMGDAAAVMVVNQMERILRENPRADHRHYLHHVAVLPPGPTLEKMARLGIGVASQPSFTVALGAYAEEALSPAQQATQNPTRSLLKRGIKVSYGSDNAPYGPLVGIYAAVTRRGWDDKVKGAGEAVTLDEALRLHTQGSAYFSFDEKTRGSLEVGKLADMVVLTEDITRVDPVRIRDIRVERTIVSGREIFVRR
jgi:predicted amidohydrolase YtcJ